MTCQTPIQRQETPTGAPRTSESSRSAIVDVAINTLAAEGPAPFIIPKSGRDDPLAPVKVSRKPHLWNSTALITLQIGLLMVPARPPAHFRFSRGISAKRKRNGFGRTVE